MKKRIALGVIFVMGAATGVAALMALTGKPVVPVAEASAAEPAKADAGEYSSQYESTKARVVVDKLAGTYQSLTNFQQVKAEYELRCYASRTRGSGKEVYRVGIRRQYLKIEGVKEMPDADYREFLSDDAASGVRFIDRMNAAKKAADLVDYAVIRWDARVYEWTGAPIPIDITELTTTYDGNVKLSATTLGALSTMKDWCQDDTARFAKLLTEGLKDVEALKKAEWSPTP